jgi:hypothetical protein
MPTLRIHSIAACMLVSCAVVGCATTIPVLPAATSKSQFEGAAYTAVRIQVEKPTPAAELYRAFQQGATGFVPVSGVRGGVEELAINFCSRKGRVVRLVEEATSPALFLPGNFPRVEWLFECAELPEKLSQPVNELDRLTQLDRLKRLLDNGTLTQKEFDDEKTKILASPQRLAK